MPIGAMGEGGGKWVEGGCHERAAGELKQTVEQAMGADSGSRQWEQAVVSSHNGGSSSCSGSGIARHSNGGIQLLACCLGHLRAHLSL
mmetsp:Transcript_40618/g.94126  ORF Transcript_40618/g.94126 Transcript_40618/m.94126 type:complete len:88 (+) Transcript_40618:108-371(+)